MLIYITHLKMLEVNQLGQLIARLTSLGWTCVGELGQIDQENAITNSTLFLRKQKWMISILHYVDFGK